MGKHSQNAGPNFSSTSSSAFFFFKIQGWLIGYTQPGRVYNVAICKFSEWNKLAIFMFLG
jgi:hypothetical protein